MLDKQTTFLFVVWEDETKYQNEKKDAYRSHGGSKATIAHGIESKDNGLTIIPPTKVLAP